MTPDDVAKALPTVGLVGTLGVFLPSIDKSWNESPADDGYKRRLRSGERTYLLLTTTLGLLASYAFRTWTPLVLCVGLGLTVVAVHEHALTADA
jgi:hypothetical protein